MLSEKKRKEGILNVSYVCYNGRQSQEVKRRIVVCELKEEKKEKRSMLIFQVWKPQKGIRRSKRKK